MKTALDIIPLTEWLPHEKPLLISGPCSAETEAQVKHTARALATHTPVKILRAGIWKPRTRPDSFEGIGAEALPWLREAGKENGLLTATEVATAEHVELCLHAGIDILWIGARTTANPFSVQEIADALRGKDVPVFVKNPVNPDFSLWVGALERINRAGIRRIAAVHRGFSSFDVSQYRNKPMWEMAIELKRQLPQLAVICDPSHMAGRRELIAGLAQKALDLDMDGLMIETHPDPDTAWSDAAQQLTPEALALLLQTLKVRSSDSSDRLFYDKLEALRARIDDLDEQVLRLLAARMEIAQQIGEYKYENDVTIFQLQRWQEIVKTRSEWGADLGLDSDFLQRYLLLIHKESIRLQTAVMSGAPKGKASE